MECTIPGDQIVPGMIDNNYGTTNYFEKRDGIVVLASYSRGTKGIQMKARGL